MKPGAGGFVEKSESSINESERKTNSMKKIFALLLVCLVSSVSTKTANSDNQNTATKPRREVAITFDDLPATHGNLQRMTDVTKRLLQSLKANQVPAIGFVNERKLYQQDELNPQAVALLKMW